MTNRYPLVQVAGAVQEITASDTLHVGGTLQADGGVIAPSLMTTTINASGSPVTLGAGATGLILGAYAGGSNGAICSASVTPNTTNYALVTNGSQTVVNGSTQTNMAVGGASILTATASGANVTGAFATSGTITISATESLRSVGDGAYHCFWNSANSTRNGYIQYLTGGQAIFMQEQGTGMAWGTAGGVHMTMDTHGNIAGTASAAFNGTVTSNLSGSPYTQGTQMAFCATGGYGGGYMLNDTGASSPQQWLMFSEYGWLKWAYSNNGAPSVVGMKMDTGGNIVGTASASFAGGVGVSQTACAGVGVALDTTFATGNVPVHGLFYGYTANFGTCGSVTGLTATYFTTDTTAGRGWIFKSCNTSSLTTGNVASISTSGAMTVLSLTQTSDERKKKNWVVLDGLVERAASLEKYGTFEWVEGGEREAGVGAQSFEAVLSEAVKTDLDGNKTLAYGPAALVLAVELSKRIVEMEKTIAELKLNMRSN